jgi:hypothetical protein
MRQANTLRLMLDRLAVHDGCLENLRDTSMNGVTKIFNSAARGSEHDRLRVIRLLALGLCVHSDKVKLLPHEFHQLINVPSVLRADGNRIGDSIKEIELLNAD